MKGNVLIIQKDESDSNLAQKQGRMQLRLPKGTCRVEFEFNAGMFPELRKWIREQKARYVLMDSLVSLFGAAGDVNESDVGLVMYQLNSIAAEEGCAIVLTHHLRKRDKSKKGERDDISMGDLYGSAFIAAGTSDIWGVIRDPSTQEHQEPKFLLKILKPRTGVTQGGDTYALSGDTEDLSYTITDLNHDKDAISTLRKNQQKVLTALKQRTKETPLTKDEVCAATGLSDRTVKRILPELRENKSLGVHREQAPSTGGRPLYRYWAE